MDPDRPFATALAIDGDRIVAVGSDAEIRALCDASTQLLAGRGWSVTPGLTDGHQHLLWGAELGQGIDFGGAADLGQVQAMLAAAAAGLDQDAWVLGYGLEYPLLGAGFEHRMFDDAAAGRPVLVHSFDLHTAYASAEALRRAGITGPRSFADTSSIVCDETGRPTGELRERAAVTLVLDAQPELTPEQKRARYTGAIAKQNSVGITAIHQMDGDPETIATFAELEQAGLLSLHVAIHSVLTPASDPDYLQELLRLPRPRGRRWRADGVKFWIDGVVETGTAWLETPDTDGGGTVSMWPEAGHYARTARDFHDAGYRIATHAIGDRAAREVLDVYGTLPGSAGRHRIEHLETAPDSTIARFQPQGVVASIQPIHLKFLEPDLSDPWSQRLGHSHCAHAMRSGDLSAAGALVVLGSDWPVAPYDPRLGMYAARLRRAPGAKGDEAIGASRPLTGEQALAGYTVNAARACGEADLAGMLRPGHRADVVVWAADPVACPAQDVVELPVLMTIVDGQIVHRTTG